MNTTLRNQVIIDSTLKCLQFAPLDHKHCTLKCPTVQLLIIKVIVHTFLLKMLSERQHNNRLLNT